MRCRVVSIGDVGLHVESIPGSVAAFLPKMHLSDHRNMCDALMLAYQADDVLDRVMYIGKSGGVVSLRRCFCSLRVNFYCSAVLLLFCFSRRIRCSCFDA